MRDLAPCCICGSADRKVRFAETPRVKGRLPESGPYGGHYRINVCSRCGLCYSSPIFDDREVKNLYTEFSETNVVEAEINNVRATMQAYYETARPFGRRRFRALDVGCDIGLMLDVLRADGFDELYGIEPVASARAQSGERVPKVKIMDEFYEVTDFPENFFDLISLVHVVDHLVRPDAALDRIRHDLAPGGICLAVVHDVELLLARVTGEKFPVFNYFHHYFFSKRTLRLLFEACGFEVLRVVSTRNRYSLAFFLERAPFFPRSWRHALAHLSRRVGVGHISLSIPIGNIEIVARKPDLPTA